MAERLEIYKCEICGNIVVVLHGGKGQLVCCNEPMELLEAQTTKQGNEKHLPIIEKIAKGSVSVKIGSVLHPMTEKHYIEWVEVITADHVARKFFKPNSKPEVTFEIDGEILQVRAYCNIHGLWAKKTNG